LRQLYPHLTEFQLEDAERNLDDYIAVALRIWTRIESGPEALAHFESLTQLRSRPTIEPKRSNLKLSQTT